MMFHYSNKTVPKIGGSLGKPEFDNLKTIFKTQGTETWSLEKHQKSIWPSWTRKAFLHKRKDSSYDNYAEVERKNVSI